MFDGSIQDFIRQYIQENASDKEYMTALHTYIKEQQPKHLDYLERLLILL